MRLNPILRIIREITDWGLESFGRYYSTYRAFVADRNDPENLGRLKLIIPEVGGTDVIEYWALPVGMYSGLNHGSQVIPQKGEVVWVQFERGDVQRPLWQHGYMGREDYPKDSEEWKDPNCFWFKTPRGHFVRINDTKNTILIKSRLGDYIELNEKSISLVTKKHVSLGTLNKSEYSSVLGEKLLEVLGEFEGIATNLNDALDKDIKLSSGTLKYVNLAINVPITKAKIEKIKDLMPGILSQLNSLD